MEVDPDSLPRTPSQDAMSETPGEESLPQGPIITIEEEEEVMLFWDSNLKSKGVRELAMGFAEKVKEDSEILLYYRCIFAPYFILEILNADSNNSNTTVAINTTTFSILIIVIIISTLKSSSY